MRLMPAMLAVAACVLSVTAAQASQRTFVSVNGDDANTASNCALTAPCRTFAAALGVTDAGGEIVALVAGDYMPLTVTKSVTMTANPGVHAGIRTSGAISAIVINAPGAKVVLRGLYFLGTAADTGIYVVAAARLALENCLVTGFDAASSGKGLISYAPVSLRISDSTFRGNFVAAHVGNGAVVDIERSRFSGNAHVGLLVQADVPPVTTTVSVSDSEASQNSLGFWLYNGAPGGTGTIRFSLIRSVASNNRNVGLAVHQVYGTIFASISENSFTGNVNGIENYLGTVESLGNNLVRRNTQDTSGTITTIPGS